MILSNTEILRSASTIDLVLIPPPLPLNKELSLIFHFISKLLRYLKCSHHKICVIDISISLTLAFHNICIFQNITVLLVSIHQLKNKENEENECIFYTNVVITLLDIQTARKSTKLFYF